MHTLLTHPVLRGNGVEGVPDLQHTVEEEEEEEEEENRSQHTLKREREGEGAPVYKYTPSLALPHFCCYWTGPQSACQPSPPPSLERHCTHTHRERESRAAHKRTTQTCVCVCVCVCVAKQRLYKVPRLADPQEVLQQHYDVADVQHAALGLQAMADKGGERDLALSSGAAVMVAVDVLIHQQVKHQRAHKVQQQAAVLGQTCRRYIRRGMTFLSAFTTLHWKVLRS